MVDICDFFVLYYLERCDFLFFSFEIFEGSIARKEISQLNSIL